MNHVYAMCGVAFSGKSTIARRIAEKLAIELLSLDAINHQRGLSGGDGMTVAQWEETSAIAMEQLRELLLDGKSVVVDDTFSHRHLRERCNAVAEQMGARFTIVFVDTPIDTTRARRAANYARPVRPHIRDEVFERHVEGFQFPSDDEGFVRIGSEVELVTWLDQQLTPAA